MTLINRPILFLYGMFTDCRRYTGITMWNKICTGLDNPDKTKFISTHTEYIHTGDQLQAKSDSRKYNKYIWKCYEL